LPLTSLFPFGKTTLTFDSFFSHDLCCFVEGGTNETPG
jgi:hypothetical protein